MCLNRNILSYKKTASTDIVCYKFVICDKRGYLQTPYQYESVEIGETYDSELKSSYFSVEEGLHSFKTLKDCTNYKSFWRTCIIVKCIIPKGSRYYKGKFMGFKGYASNKIQYVEEVKFNSNDLCA